MEQYSICTRKIQGQWVLFVFPVREPEQSTTGRYTMLAHDIRQVLGKEEMTLLDLVAKLIKTFAARQPQGKGSRIAQRILAGHYAPRYVLQALLTMPDVAYEYREIEVESCETRKMRHLRVRAWRMK